MSVYDKTLNIYWQIKNEMDRLGCTKVPYFICKEVPHITVKHQIIAFARRLGLETDGLGTLRLTTLAPEFNEEGEKLISWYKGKKYEVYLHCCHIRNGYFSAKDSRNMLTLGFYTGS